MDYKKDTNLDITNLDLEWQRQSGLVQEYSELVAKKNREINEFNQLLTAKEAQIRLEYRTGNNAILTVDGKALKLTENALSEAIANDEELKELKKQYNELKYELDLVKGALDAIKTKTKAMEWESQLFLMGYFGEPKDQRTLIKNKNSK